MARFHSPRVITKDLRIVIDAANPKCYPGSGNTCIDLTRNGNNGTFANGVSYSSTNNGVFVFDQTAGQSINCGSSSTLNMTGAAPYTLTLSVWIYPTDYGNNTVSTIIERYQSAGAVGYRLLLDNFSRTKAFVYINDYTKFTENIVDLNVWANFVVVHEDEGLASLYKNGEFITNYFFNTEDVVYNASGTFYIGNNYLGNQPFKGNIANVSVNKGALTATEVKQNFDALRVRFGI